MDREGWVPVDGLLAALGKQGMGLDRETLEHIVENNDKRRFSFSEDGTKIRASQGHSIPVELGLTPLEPPESLYHGTAQRFLGSIWKEGLVKGSRQQVHLSIDWDTARKVGIRHGIPVVLRVRAGGMFRDGYTFYRSANGVWLTEAVPRSYLEKDGVDRSFFDHKT